ncbi:unnamed protein product [Acanthoscelides obtectus]|uniref:Uncharacterized protein n=1 Tax=Acanthoscelides obtectus TaxID=200917 RepID=A0A9P0KQ22_ACAOB|nr:unnamed protein product [Acanthoscelides obtectus]CAK1656925.1 hypothetical protein AOBTE_LOCUS20020 [Acanthoscelides obtectus]
MILLSGLIFRSSVMTFGKQMMVYQSAETVICSLRGIFDTNRSLTPINPGCFLLFSQQVGYPMRN